MLKILQTSYSIINKKHRANLNFLYIIFFISMILETMSIGLFIPILNNFAGISSDFNQYIPDFFRNNPKDNIFYLLFILGIIFTFKTIFLSYSSYEKEKFAWELNDFLSKKSHNIYLKKKYAFHIKNNSSALIRDINDVKFGTDFFKGLINLISEILILIGIIALISIYNPLSTFIIFSLIGSMGFIFYKFIQSKAKKWGEQRQKFEEKRFFNLQLSFNEIKNIKLSNKENFFNKVFSESNLQTVKANFKNHFISSLPKLWMEWITLVIISFLIFILINIGVDFKIILAQIGLYAIAAYRIVPSITRIMNAVQAIRFGTPVILKIKEIFKNQEDEVFALSNFNIEFKNKLEFKNITFSYNLNEPAIFENLNLEITPNSFNGIKGKSGAGKSTVVNILAGLLIPTKGKILADNSDIKENLKSWQSKIGYVPQNVFLGDLSIRENIAFGENNDLIDEKKLIRAVSLARLDRFVKDLEHGLDTKIGEFGSQISGGQKQRIGIARALYNIPQILILDESTNALDENTENEILQDILKLKTNNITLFSISHDEKSLSICDNIYEIKNKKIIKL